MAAEGAGLVEICATVLEEIGEQGKIGIKTIANDILYVKVHIHVVYVIKK